MTARHESQIEYTTDLAMAMTFRSPVLVKMYE